MVGEKMIKTKVGPDTKGYVYHMREFSFCPVGTRGPLYVFQCD